MKSLNILVVAGFVAHFMCLAITVFAQPQLIEPIDGAIMDNHADTSCSQCEDYPVYDDLTWTFLAKDSGYDDYIIEISYGGVEIPSDTLKKKFGTFPFLGFPHGERDFFGMGTVGWQLSRGRPIEHEGFDLEGWSWRVVGIEFDPPESSWSEIRSFTVESDTFDCACLPYLISPDEGDTLENGCQGYQDTVIWNFEWTPAHTDDYRGNNIYYPYFLHISGNGFGTVEFNAHNSTHYTFKSGVGACFSDTNSYYWRVSADAYYPLISEYRTFHIPPCNSSCNYISLEPDQLEFTAFSSGGEPESKPFTITNPFKPASGNNRLHWLVTEEIDWLSCSPTSGIGDTQVIDVSVESTDYLPDTLDDIIMISSPNANNSPQLLPIRLILFPPPVIVEVTDNGTGDGLFISWNQPQHESVSGYRIFWRDTLANLDSGDFVYETNEEIHKYNVTGLQEHCPYYLGIRAYTSSAASSIIWNSVTIMPTKPIFLVHGFRETAFAWAYFAERLDGFNNVFMVNNLNQCGEFNEYYFSGNAANLSYYIESKISDLENRYNVNISDIDIVAHSMGGLISRRYCSPASTGWPKRAVRNLIMLGTPNRGSKLAELAIAPISCLFSDCIICPAIDQMTPASMLQFNRIFPNSLSTAYYSFWGSGGGYFSCYGTIAGRFEDKPNDGPVSIISAIDATPGKPFWNIVYNLNRGTTLCHNEYMDNADLYYKWIEDILLGRTLYPKNIDNLIEDSLGNIPPQIAYMSSGVIQGGVTLSDSFIVEANTDITVALIIDDTLSSFYIGSPGGIIYDSLLGVPDTNLFYSNDRNGVIGYHISNAETGQWIWHIDAIPSSATTINYRVMEIADNSILAKSNQNSEYISNGDSLCLQVDVKMNDVGITNLSVTALPIFNHTDTLIPVLFYDDGNHEDGSSSDGIYGTIIHKMDTGIAKYAITVNGNTPLGYIKRHLSTLAYWYAYLCGDANGDGKVNLLDILFLISYKFKGGPAPNPLLSGDANADSKIDLLDILYLISYKYKGGAAPNCP